MRIYDRTIRRIPRLHGLTRFVAWRGSRVAVRTISSLTRFRVPDESLLPLYQLQMLLGFYERDTVAACRRIIHPGMIVIDVGAHVGYFTLIFARLVGRSGHVFAFEPHPANYELLSWNVSRHASSNVTLIRKAVSDHPGEVDLLATPFSMAHSLIVAKGGSRRIEVGATSLDAFATEHGIRSADVIKIDVEGAEPLVLAGMHALVQRSPQVVVVLEFKPRLLDAGGYQPSSFLRALFHQGFDLSTIERGGLLKPIELGSAEQFARAVDRTNIVARRRM